MDLRTGGKIRADDIVFGDVTDYIGSSQNVTEVTVTTADGTPVQTYVADLTGLGGASITVLASGFLSPEDDQDGPAFCLLAVTGDGTSFCLPTASDELLAAEVPGATSLTVGALALDAPYPNPASGEATVAFALPSEGAVRVALYDALGREVAVVAEGTFEAGQHTAKFDASAMPAGVYILRLDAEGATRTQRMTVVR